MDLRKRIHRLSKSIHSAAYVAVNRSDIYYLTGVDLDGYYIVVMQRKVYAFCTPLLKGQLELLLKGVSVITVEKPVDELIHYMRKRRIKTLMLNPKAVSHVLFIQLRKHFKIKESDIISKLRQIKEKAEIEKIRKSCKIALKVYKLARKLTVPGRSEEEIAFKIEEYFAKFCSRPAFRPIVAFGPNTANPHHVSTQKKARKNEIVTIDLGSIYKGYCSDLTRTFFLGKIPTSAKTVFQVVQEAQLSAIARVHAGTKASEIDGTARRVIDRAGFGKFFVHSTGHGVGIDIHEAPGINKKDFNHLRPGMVITIEPGVYLPKKFGVRIEDTLLVTKTGFEILTK